MKKRFNFIAILIFIALATSFLVNSSLVIDDFITGWKMGSEYNANNQETQWIDISPTEDNDYIFTLPSADSQNQISFMPCSVLAKTTKEPNSTATILDVITVILAPIMIIIFIVTIIYFIKFILSVNKGFIFEVRNLRYLNILGWFIILDFICITIFSLAVYFRGVEMFDIEGYQLVLNQPLPFTWLLGGLTILLIRQFIAMGIKMKEEQDLTI